MSQNISIHFWQLKITNMERRNKIFMKAWVLFIYILLIVAIVFTSTSCNRLTIDPIMAYTIDEGTHESYSYNWGNRKRENIIAPILVSGNRLDWNFMFKDMHKYDYTVKDGDDINKLYGITSTKIHENSARIGWRYVGDENFEVFAYYYVRGVRNWELISTVKTNEDVLYSIDVSNHNYTFGVNNDWIHVTNTKNILAARAFPYFGGNNTAPHKMVFKIVER